LLIYVNSRSLDRPEMAEFVRFYMQQDEALIREVAGIPMSARAYALVRERVARRAPGTLFDAGRDTGNVELLLSEGK
jgi:phosphate transport system substrate-binding protein